MQRKVQEVRPVHHFLLVFRMCRSQLSGGKNSGDKPQEFLEISWAIFDVLFRSHIWNKAGLKAGGSGLGRDGTDNPNPYPNSNHNLHHNEPNLNLNQTSVYTMPLNCCEDLPKCPRFPKNVG